MGGAIGVLYLLASLRTALQLMQVAFFLVNAASRPSEEVLTVLDIV